MSPDLKKTASRPSPLILPSVALCLGAVMGSSLPLWSAGLLLALACGAVTLMVLPCRIGMAVASAAAAALGIGAAGAAVERVAYERSSLRAWVAAHEACGPVQIEGIAAGDSEEREGRWRLTVDASSVSSERSRSFVRGRARIEIGGTSAHVQVLDGDRIAIWTELRLPLRAGTPGGTDAFENARLQDVHAVGFCKSAWLLERRGRAPLGWWRDVSARLRGWSRERFDALLRSPDEAALVKAMVLGDRSGITPEMDEAFRSSGTYHVLALSGAQVALLAGVCVLLLRRLGCPLALRAALVCLILASYSQFVGGDVPVIRAALVAAVVLWGRVIDLDVDGVNLLAFAGCVILVARPRSVADLGFQLSFAATWGVLRLGPVVGRAFPRLPFRIEQMVAASIGAQGALLPFLLCRLHRIAPMAVVLNLLAVPLSSAVLVAGLLTLVVAAVAPPCASVVAWPTALLARGLAWSAWIGSAWPQLDPRLPTPSTMALLVYIGSILAIGQARARSPASWLVGLGLLLSSGAQRFPVDGRLRLSVIDVGQGDALLVRSPRGRGMLIDTGGSPDGRFDVGEAIVAPYLWSEGRRGLDRMVITHAHPDHVGGAPFLMRAFKINEVWEGLAPRSDAGYARFNAAARTAGVERRAVVRGLETEWDGVKLRVLWPPPGPPPWRARNDDSVVIQLDWDRVSLLLSADLEAPAEASVDVNQAAVLKVPHHGSRTSSTPGFVERVRPRVALVSVGRRNRFGHPDVNVLRRYEGLGAWIYRTDRDGAITVTTDGRQVWVQTADDPRERVLPR